MTICATLAVAHVLALRSFAQESGAVQGAADASRTILPTVISPLTAAFSPGERETGSHVRNRLTILELSQRSGQRLPLPVGEGQGEGERDTRPNAHGATTSVSVHPIDLQTALRLAGAQNLDIQIARQKLAEAKANHAGALLQFFPWLTPGAGYRRHTDRIQEVAGNVFDADKQSYTAGATLAAQWEFGEAIYKSLAAKQLVNAAGHAVEAQRQDTTLAAAQGYFDLLMAQASVGIAEDALRISENYHAQVQRAVEAGIAFRGDELRVKVQVERNQLARRQALEHQRLAAARLAQILRLEPSLDLKPAESELAPLELVATNLALNSAIHRALIDRPEVKQNEGFVAAAKNSRHGAIYGPWIPSVGAQAFVGGLGGGREDSTGNI